MGSSYLDCDHTTVAGGRTRARQAGGPPHARAAACIVAAVQLAGCNVLVTGTSRGLGRAIARLAAERGARVLCHARREPDARAAAAEVGGVPLWGELTDGDAIAAIARAAAEAAAALDVLVHNAGVLRRTTLRDVSRDDLELTLATNLYAPILLTQALLGPLRAAASPRVVVVSSNEGQFARDRSGGSLSYRASKAAVNMAVANMAAELEPDGVLVNAVHPGWVVTDMGGPGSYVPAQQAAAEVLYAAELPDGDVSGRFFWQCQEIAW
jgi:NAD(P)-dependent dehydrogenase (short-subunit alcohol dehydrogenase family)